MSIEALQVAPLRVGVVGVGAIGRAIITGLKVRPSQDIELVSVAAGDGAKAASFLSSIGCSIPVERISDVVKRADLIVECAPSRVLGDIARPALENGKTVLVLSVGALLANPDLLELARRRRGRIVVPTGALLGLDAVAAASEGIIHSVRMKTSKPVKGLVGARYLVERGIDIGAISKATKVFEGTAREAARGFPENLNVAVALSLAGIGPDRTMMEVWADPNLQRNTHHIEVDADSASFEMTIRNIPSDNPRTGRITALSAIATLRKLRAALHVGT